MEAFVDSNGQATILGDERVDVILLYLRFPAYDDRHGHSRFLARKQREDLFIRIGIDDEDAMFRFEKERVEEIPGIGPARRRELLKAFGSVKAIREAGTEDLEKVKGMNRTAAEAVRAWAENAKK